MSYAPPVCEWYDEAGGRNCWDLVECKAPNGGRYCFRHLVSYYRSLPREDGAGERQILATQQAGDAPAALQVDDDHRG